MLEYFRGRQRRNGSGAGASSTQPAVAITFPTSYQAGRLFNIQSSSGESLITFAPLKRYRSVVFSSPDLRSGSTCSLYLDGSSTGTVNDGLYSGGTYTPGSKYVDFTMSSIVTTVR